MSKPPSTTLNLKLLGKVYQIACAVDDQDSLHAAASLLEGKLHAISAITKCSGERLAIMAALDLAHEMLTAGQSVPDSTSAHTNENLQRTIDSIEARINLALEQD